MERPGLRRSSIVALSEVKSSGTRWTSSRIALACSRATNPTVSVLAAVRVSLVVGGRLNATLTVG